MRSWTVCLVILLAAGGCGQSTRTQCMTMGGPSALVTDAKLFRLDVYPDTVACDGSEVPAGSVPLLSQSFQPGDEVKLSVPPGMRTLVLTTFADDAGTIIMGSGCTTTELKPGAQVCINLTLTPAPDIAMLTDLSTVDVASCSGSDCPCTSSPDDCPANQFCNAQQMCQAGCKVNGDCVGVGPATDGGLPRTSCNPTLHQCVECTASSQCALGKLCSPSGVCTTGCDASHACPGALTCCNSLCVDTTSDPLNCGICNTPCVNKTGTCCASSCVSLDSSPDNCGSCGRVCSAAGVALRQCTTGACTPICAFGKGDCNSAVKPVPNDGCETDTTTTTNCGACGAVCDTTAGKNASAPTCYNVPDGGAATCKYSCMAPFADCANVAPDTDGCETNTSNDVLNCGACTNACNTTNNNNTSCNSSVCGKASCKTNQADCVNPGINHNQDECETLATDATQACGTDSCTPCLTGGIITTRACTVPGSGSAFCSYTCSNTTCPNTNASAHTCDGVRCAYTCNSARLDCNAGTAPNNDGCECGTSTTPPDGGCCTSNACETQHTTGLTNAQLPAGTAQTESQRYFDCSAVESGTWDQNHGMRACIAWMGGAALGNGFCAQYTCGPAANGIFAVCSTKNVGLPTQQCACWILTGTLKGTAFIDSSSDCSGCSQSGGAAWN